MELIFGKVGNQYVAEFEAPSDFNLHIEREEIGVLEVHQRGSEEGKYDFAWSTGVSGRKVVDYDFGALVYPKYIKVVSGSEVISASVNFNEGGGSGSGESGSSSVDEHVIYYSFGEKTNIYEIYSNDEVKYSIAGVRTTWNEINTDTYMYGSYNAMNDIFGSKTQDFYPDAFIFAPISIRRYYDNSIAMSSVSYEQLCEKYPDLPKATRITAEEYWQYLKS